MSYRKLPVAGAVAAMLVSWPASMALAQEKPVAKAAADSIEEVIVTARRKEENLQAVPISVTLVTGEALNEKGVSNPYDLDMHVPSLTTGLSGSMTKGLMFGIRGIRSSSFLLLDDPPVGTYYAESPVSHPWGFGETFFDIQSMQVLKGPQGTLFGRNTTGGAVLIEPNKPSIDEGFHGSIKAALGDYNMQQLTGMINIPINDVAALRIAAEHKKRDGYTTNILSGQKRDGLGYDAIRVGLLLKPTRDITSTTLVDYLTEDADATAQQLVAVYGPNGGAGLGPGISNATLNQILREQQARGPYKIAMLGGTNFALPTTDPRYAFTGQDQHSPLKCDPSSPYFVAGQYCRKNMKPRETLTNLGILNNTSIDFNGVTVKNIFSYRRMSHRHEDSSSFPFGLQGNGNVTGQYLASSGPLQTNPAGGGTADQNNKQSQVTEELQLQGKSVDDKLDWVTGLFYMREWGEEFSPSYTNSFNWSNTAGHGRNISKGIFAQGTYAVTDRLKWTLGYRKSWDNRNATDTSTATKGTVCQEIIDGVRRSINACAMNAEANYAANTYTAGLDYKINDDTMAYVLRSRGYKSGGFSLRSHNNRTWSYAPEFVVNNEVGIKSDWTLFDRPVRTNLSAYKSVVTDQQLQATVAGSNPVLTNVQNIGESEIFGFEFEYIFKATSNLEISGYFSYVDPKYTKWEQFTGATSPYGTVDLTYRPFGFASLKNAGLTIDYKLPLDSSIGDIKLRADASFHSRWEADNRQAGLVGLAAGVQGAIPTVQGFTMFERPGMGLLNLRADWYRAMGSPVDLALFVTNATDRAYYLGGSALNGFVTAPVAPPRMFGVELSYKFGDGFKPKD